MPAGQEVGHARRSIRSSTSRSRASSAKAPADARPDAPASDELLTVKLRYKQPDGDTSTKQEFPLVDGGAAWQQASTDFIWASAVAGFGMLLRESPHAGETTWPMVLDLAGAGIGPDRHGYRNEFMQLAQKARRTADERRRLTSKNAKKTERRAKHQPPRHYVTKEITIRVQNRIPSLVVGVLVVFLFYLGDSRSAAYARGWRIFRGRCAGVRR